MGDIIDVGHASEKQAFRKGDLVMIIKTHETLIGRVLDEPRTWTIPNPDLNAVSPSSRHMFEQSLTRYEYDVDFTHRATRSLFGGNVVIKPLKPARTSMAQRFLQAADFKRILPAAKEREELKLSHLNFRYG